MNDEFVVFEQRLIDGVVVSIGVDAILLNAVKKGGINSGRSTVEYRMRRVTEQEKQDHRDGIDLAKWLPV